MTYNGYCPEYGKLLVKDVDTEAHPTENRVGGRFFEVRCPSCDTHYHQLNQLVWEEK
jgi:hypothetical protein